MSLPQVRDILYFDFEKASSIWSQLQWGQLEKISVTSEGNTDRQVEAGLGIPNLANLKINVGEGEKRTILETRILHHDLLNRIEALLSHEGFVININQAITPDEASPEVIHEAIGNTPFIFATGSSVIEDYQRILLISEKFNELAKFIGQCAAEGIKKSPEYNELSRNIDELRETSKSITDRNKKAQIKAKTQNLESAINNLLNSQIKSVDQWMLDGIKLWITTFIPTRINFRVYPFPNCPSFQILCNLKRNSFVDQDLEHLLYGYGTHPNIPLSIFGLVTSIPPKSGIAFDPLSEFTENTHMSDEMVFEKAFRGIFGAMEGLENFVKYSRYPNITIHPIAVFRLFR